MTNFFRGAFAAAALMLATTATPVFAQADSKYVDGPLWFVSAINVEDGQFENYMDYLAGNWKKTHDFAIKEGVELAYHVLAVTAKRADEPDLYLVVTSKDYLTVAQQLAFEAKLNAMLSETRRTAEAGSAKRAPLRKLGSRIELRELILK